MTNEEAIERVRCEIKSYIVAAGYTQKEAVEACAMEFEKWSPSDSNFSNKLDKKERSIVNDCPRLISMNRKTENYKMRRNFRRIFCESMNVEDTAYDRDSLLGKVYADPA